MTQQERDEIFLRAWEEAQGNPGGRVDLANFARELLLPTGEVRSAWKYFVDKGFWKVAGAGLRVAFTALGIDYAEALMGERQISNAEGNLDNRMAPKTSPDPKKVFIIHGRNTAARVAIEHFVRALGLQAIDFDELAADCGPTAFVGDVVRAGLQQAHGIVALFTPDEFAALRPDHRGERDKLEELQRWQARPNVIFEAGMAYGMAPERTVLVTLGTDVSLFSDLAGVLVVRLTNNVDSRKKLRQKLIGMKCAVDQRGDTWTDVARSGDFDSCINQLKEVSPLDPFSPQSKNLIPTAGSTNRRPIRTFDDVLLLLERHGLLYAAHQAAREGGFGIAGSIGPLAAGLMRHEGMYASHFPGPTELNEKGHPTDGVAEVAVGSRWGSNGIYPRRIEPNRGTLAAEARKYLRCLVVRKR